MVIYICNTNFVGGVGTRIVVQKHKNLLEK
jgi:hypothetical protein